MNKTKQKQPDGKKAHNDDKIIIVGRIRYNSWATKVLKARNIAIYESGLVHIQNRHKKELSLLGQTALDFVNFIVKNYNQIRQGTGDSFLLCVKRENISNVAAIRLAVEENQYIIKTVMLYNNAQLFGKKLLCANDH